VDERRDVIASTNAALDYLQTIYEMHGDWHLALASYNWGEGAVGRAVAKNRAAGLPTEYQHLNMPGETRYYVPKLQALKNIVAQPELFGITLPRIPNRPYFVTVESRVALDLATAARLAETVDEILALNPGYKRPVLPTNGSMSLVIPADKVEAFLVNLQRHDPASASWTYELREGEGLEGVADRLGISASRLRQVNGCRRGRASAAATPDRALRKRGRPHHPVQPDAQPAPGRCRRAAPALRRVLVQHTVRKHGRTVVIERRVPVSGEPAASSRSGKGGRHSAEAESSRSKGSGGKHAATPPAKPSKKHR
jgi:membrane-bound lytic murein transglycosylase D